MQKLMGGSGDDLKAYRLSPGMMRYIVSDDPRGGYQVGRRFVNRSIAATVTSREGNTRADASTYLSPDFPQDAEIGKGDDGLPKLIGRRMEKEMGDYEQIDLFAATAERYRIAKPPIRLIEFFAGIGAQAKSLEALGARFEHWRVSEWSIHSIIAYNAIHIQDWSDHTEGLSYDEVLDRLDGVSSDYNKPMTRKELKGRGEQWARRLYSSMVAIHDLKPNVMTVHAEDLGIEPEREREHCYVLTYSFPCQDLSNAGQQKGMGRGSGTRSGLLWEVERVIKECAEKGCRPDVLIMENVPGVIGERNKDAFSDWVNQLRILGYSSFHKVMNAKDYGIPQNRKRCFMVSILGDYGFDFPPRMRLKYRLKDFIEKEVDGSYYLSEEIVRMFREHTERQKAKGNGFEFKPTDGDCVGGDDHDQRGTEDGRQLHRREGELLPERPRRVEDSGGEGSPRR